MDILEDLRKYASNFCGHIGTSLNCIIDDIDIGLAKRYLLLPVDADCIPIHIGDMMVDEFGHVFKVDGYKWWGDKWWVFQDTSIQSPAELCTHYKPPTVEDLLKEFGEEWSATLEDYELDVLIAEYADKIRLAKENE